MGHAKTEETMNQDRVIEVFSAMCAAMLIASMWWADAPLAALVLVTLGALLLAATKLILRPWGEQP